MNNWRWVLSIVLLGLHSILQVWSADRQLEPIRLNGIRIDVATLAETQPFHLQSVESAGLIHALVQFRQSTSPKDRQRIEQTGIRILHYVPPNAYFISGPMDTLNALRNDARIVGVIPVPSEAKIDAGIRERIGEGEAPAEPQISETVKVLFHPETTFKDARKILLAHGAILEATRTGFDFRQTLNAITLPADQIEPLAGEDSVFLITGVDPPAVPADIAAQDTSNVDEIQSGGITGYDLDGTGVTVGMWDIAFVRCTHEQIIGRATQEDWDSSPSFNAHSCHVAGIIAGNGTGNAQAEGMAPNVTLLCWNTIDDLAEVDANAHRISVSNHSYASSVNQEQNGNTEPSDSHGNYNSRAQAWDRIVADHGLIVVRAAGNERISSAVSVNADYDTILPSGVAKNVITVGAIDARTEEPPIPDDSSMTDFSSWGPTDDGRIKPDVVADGVHLLSMGAESDHAYYENSGTSMSAPVVSGIAACLVQQYRRYFRGEDPVASTMKSILIHTARDGGSQVGPDYRFGWGLVDARAAADVIASNGTKGNRLVLDSYTDSFREYPMTYVGSGPIRATLVWTDPPAVPVSADDDTPNLVNDLDLHVFGPDGAHYVWTLDPSNPSLPARQDRENHRDNVEQVFIDSPVPGAYTIWVDGQVNLGDSQKFSLCISGLRPASESRRVVHVEILEPMDNDAVSGEVAISAHLLDNLGTSQVVFKVDGVIIDSTNTGEIEGQIDLAPPQRETTQTIFWDTTTVPNGRHTIRVTAVSADGLTFSRSCEVFVCNENEGIVALVPDGPPEFERIWPSGDEDWFSFQLPNSATYTVETLDVSNRANHPDTVITLYGPDSLSSPLFANDDGGDARLSRITQVLQGDCVYHVRVSGYSGSTGFYRIRLRTVPDNEPLSAIPLTVNAPMTSGVFVGGASEHLYTFRTTVSGIHSIRIFQSSQSGDSPLQIVLYRADDEKNCLSPIFPDSSLTKVLPDNQVYVVKVIPSAQLAGHYRIGVEAGATGSHVYVRADAMPGGDGFSWEKAFNSIGSALEVMWATGEVWAAAGTYSESVEMKPGIAIYGGFTGTEQTREDRDWAGNETVINAGRLFASAVTGADGALLDGFTVTGGQRSGVFCPSGSSPTFSNCILRTNKSFGVHCQGSSPTLINCTISENPGGAIYCSDSRLTLTNCMISENSARQGGGIRCSRSSLTLTNCTVALNSVEVSGGGIYCEDSSATLTNCIITGNSAEGGGGGIYSTKSFPTLTNCTIARNVAGRGSGLWSESGSLSLTNCILWNPGSEIEGSVVATYSCIQGGWPGQGNISHYPEFVDSTNGDYHLRNGSPCVDTGLVSVAPAEDIEEHNRPGADGLVDMGAYESPAEYESGIGREPLRLAYVCADADPGGDGLSWESAFNSIGAALEMIRVTGEIWVAAGRYSESIGMEPGLTLYGGFSGVEKTQKERDWKRNETIIDAAGLGSVAVTGAQGSSLDGFTVTGGKNGGVRCHESSPKVINCTIHKNPGGGVCCMGEASPMLIHCTIRENSDSGVFCDSGASPIVIDCTITGNSTLYGGGVYCDGGSSPTLTDCTITGNFSSYGGGGVCCQESSSPIFANCTISDNGGSGDRPSRDGGGVYCRRSSPTLTNCIIAGNKARNGGGIYCESGAFPKLINCSFSGNSANNGNALACVPRWPPSEPEFTNCILWDGGNEISIYENPTITVSYSNIQGGWSGEGNIDRDPLFVRPWDGEGADLHLMPDSPCIDAGNPDSSYNDASLPPGLCRERGDMGAYGGPQNSGWPEEPGLPVGISEWTLY